jgi:long-chain fatty acid transport protein
MLNLALSRLDVNDLEIDMNSEQTAPLSIAHQLNEQRTLMSSVNWQDWSDFGDMGVSVKTAAGNVSRSVDRNYQDTWSVDWRTKPDQPETALEHGRGSRQLRREGR